MQAGAGYIVQASVAVIHCTYCRLSRRLAQDQLHASWSAPACLRRRVCTAAHVRSREWQPTRDGGRRERVAGGAGGASCIRRKMFALDHPS